MNIRLIENLKLQLHERVFACYGDAIFFKLSRHRGAVMATLGDKVRDFVARNSTH